ncbi:anthrone oxygenase family protein [Microvirga brassicacearum]|uniref:DUF1772 domain-containing protein n=1 Tax=Microvirga brassicacearum TaxID=2580413 RepID=A0A5N3P3V1_9HYPH|nr:anthrone oxygenase family protein [Microvirga brassicacearum]KAB0264416.1 DUF1772 domain-containing protein [Microvirga brassicacearum]
MLQVLEVLTVVLTAVAMTFALAHAAELPGKMRLNKETYLAVQPIYYPGFTIGGFSEPASTIAVIVLMFFTPFASAAFWWIAAALISLLVMQLVYWTTTHPVNKLWLKDQKLKGAGAGFFSIGQNQRDTRDPEDWQALRNRWEYSHVVRAGLALLGLCLLVIGVTTR